MKTLLLMARTERERQIYRDYLKKLNYTIVEAENSLKGLEICQKQPPHLIIFALNLSKNTELEGFQNILEYTQKYDLPAIAIGDRDSENAIAHLPLESHTYLVKDCLTPKVLQNAIAQALEYQAVKQQLRRSQAQRNILASMLRDLRATRPLNEILQTVAQQVRQCFDVDRVVIHRFDTPSSGEIVAESVRSPWHSISEISFNPEETAAFPSLIEKYSSNSQHRTDNLEESCEFTPQQKQILRKYQVQACLAVPIALSDCAESATTPWGLLILHQCQGPRTWQEDNISLLTEIVQTLAIAIQQALLFEQLQQHNQALQVSEHRFKTAVESMNDGLWEWNIETGEVYFSRRWKTILGYQEDELPNSFESWSSSVHPDDYPRVQQTIHNYAQRQADKYRIEYRLRHKNGSYRWILAHGVGTWNAQNQLIHLMGSHTDITKRHQTLEELKASEARFRLLAENSSDIVVRTTPEGEILYISPACQTILGYKPEELIGKITWDYLHSDDRLRLQQAQTVSQETQETSVFRACHQQGHYVWLEAKTKAVLDPVDGTTLELQTSIRDIGDRAKAEQERDRLVALLEATPDFVGIANTNLETVWTNRQVRQLYGHLGDEEYQHKPIDDIHPDWALEKVKTQGIPTAIREGVWQGETAILDEKGQEIPVSQIIIAHRSGGEIDYFSTILHDIRDRVTAETKVRQREKILRDLLDSLHSFVGLMTPDGILIEANRAPLQAANLQYEDVINKPFVEAYWWSHSQQAQANLKDAIARALRQEAVRYDAVVRVGENQFITLDFTIGWICDDQGQVRYLVPSGIDITERRQAEEALLQSEARVKYLLSSSPTTIYTCKAEGDFGATFMSDNVKTQLGYQPQQFTQDSGFWANNIHPDDREEVFAGLKTLFAEDFYNHEYRFRINDGSYCWVRDDVKLIRDSLGRPIEIIGSWLDISDRKRSEMLLQQRDAYLQALVNIQSQLLRGVTPETDIYDQVLPILGELVGVDKVCVFENYTNDQKQFCMRYVWEWCQPGIASTLNDSRFQSFAYDTFPGWAETLAEGEPVVKVNSDYNEAEACILGDCGAKALLLIPLQINNRFFGYVAFDSMTGTVTWEKQQIGLLKLAVNAIALAKERQIAQTKLQTQFAAIEAATDGIAITDAKGNYIYLNRTHLELFGYSSLEELVGKPWSLMYYPEEAQRLEQEIFPQLLQTKTWRGEGLARRKDGSTFTEEFSLTLMPGGELVCVCRDITQRKQADAQIRQTNQRLARINAELERATRLKDEFLANMSHELRTPLNAILGLSEALQEEVYGSLSDRQCRSIQTIEKSGQHLLELINDILDLAKIESGKMELQLAPTSVRRLAESSLTFVKQMAQRKKIKLKTQLPPGDMRLAVDERRIRQALINLLSNAVKFTPEGGQITLELQGDVATETVNFSVIDTGIGIAPENLPKLFQPFVQIDSSLSRSYAGTGLGLALVQRVAEMHGGSVAVDSELGQGSTFIISLPWQSVVYSQPTPSPSTPEAAIAPLLSNSVALVIHEGSNVTTTIKQLLDKIGLQTIIYPEGEGAVRLAERIQPGVAILGAQLPDLSGQEVLQQFQGNAATRDLPIILLTETGNQDQALEQGAIATVSLPIDGSCLYAAIAKVIPKTPKAGDEDESPVAPSVSIPQLQNDIEPLILLAEDNDDNVKIIKDYLISRNYRLIRAKNGIEALDYAEKYRPDLILMDIQMPQMDGLTAIRHLRAHPEADVAQIPVIALTALAMLGDRDRCLAAGANNYMTKPVSLKTLSRNLKTELKQES
ncbi:MAG: PAS domain S-box protein [Spirulinaceae cyanobacterium]